ncbi:YidC/Oxa1 family membrane protein insertase [Patescibacteria group bacterium]
MNIWHLVLYQPLVNLLILFYKILAQNLGLAIIGLTMAIRTVLIPLTKPSLEAAKKMKDLAPELNKLKEKHKKDKQALAQAQLALYKKHGVNPGAGCLPQIVQIIILIALFQAFNQVLSGDGDIVNKLNDVLYGFLRFKEGEVINTNFLYLNLTNPDLIKLPFELNFFGFKLDKLPGLFLIAAAVSQYFSSKTMMPQAKVSEEKAKKTPQQEDDMAATMQKQMLYMMPLMTLIIGFKFASGLVLYWLTFSLFMLIQQLKMQSKK